MTSSSPGHVVSLTSPPPPPLPPPRQLSVSDLFTYQRPRRSAEHRVAADHVTSGRRCCRPEPEVDDERLARRRPAAAASSSLDDSAIDNQSTSSGGSRGPVGRRTRSIAVIPCSSGDVTPAPMTSQTSMAAPWQDLEKRSCGATTLSCREADGTTTVYRI